MHSIIGIEGIQCIPHALFREESQTKRLYRMKSARVRPSAMTKRDDSEVRKVTCIYSLVRAKRRGGPEQDVALKSHRTSD